MMSSRRPVHFPAYWVVAAIFVGWSLWRLQYGVDPSDEAFYLAVPYRFTLGSVPFRDEWHLTQTGSMLLTPLVWLYTRLVGSTFAMVLSARLFYFACMLAIALTLYRVIRPRFGAPVALLSAILPALSIPFNIYGWCYNTFGSSFLCLGLFFAWAGKEDPRRFFWSGLFLTLAAWTYPSYLFVALLVTIQVGISRLRNGNPATAGRFFAGLATAGAPLLVLVTVIGWENLNHSIRYTGKANHVEFTIRHAASVLRATLGEMGPKLPIVTGIALVGAVARFRPALTWLALCALFGMMVGFPSYSGYPASLVMNTRLALVGALLSLVLGSANLRSLFYWIGMPSLFAGLLTGMTSTNGPLNSGFGALAAAIVCLIAVGQAMSATRYDLRLGRLLPFVLLFSFLWWHQWRANGIAYQDGSIAEMSVRLHSGPFAGLRTYRRRAEFLGELESNIVPLTRKASGVLYYSLSAGYLYQPVRPIAGSTWTQCYSPEQFAQVLEYYQRHDDGNALFIWDKPEPTEKSEPPENRLLSWVLAHGARIYDSPRFAVFRRADADRQTAASN